MGQWRSPNLRRPGMVCGTVFACHPDVVTAVPSQFLTGDHIMAAWRQVEIHRQAETESRAHCRRLRGSGVPAKEAKSRGWATVNKESGGGNKSGSGRGKPDTNVSSKKGGEKGGAASASRSAQERSASAKKAAATRKRHQGRRLTCGKTKPDYRKPPGPVLSPRHGVIRRRDDVPAKPSNRPRGQQDRWLSGLIGVPIPKLVGSSS